MQTVAETPTFSRQADNLFSKDEKRQLINFLAQNPLIGEQISGTSGVRKWYFGAYGVWIIYYYPDEAMPIYALLAYAKPVRTDMTPVQRRAVQVLVADLKATWRR